MKSTLKICLLFSILIVSSCSSVKPTEELEKASTPTPNFSPTHSPTQNSVPTILPTSTMIPTPTPMSVTSLEKLDHWDFLIPAYDLFPQGLTYKRNSDGIEILWQDEKYFFSCGSKIDDILLIWSINHTDIYSSIGYPVTVNFFNEDYKTLSEEMKLLLEKGQLRLMFDPYGCEFVMTDKQRLPLDQDGTSASVINGVEPYATQNIIIVPNKEPKHSQLSSYILNNVPDLFYWSYQYLGEGVSSHGYFYPETGEKFVYILEEGDISPILMVNPDAVLNEE